MTRSCHVKNITILFEANLHHLHQFHPMTVALMLTLPVESSLFNNLDSISHTHANVIMMCILFCLFFSSVYEILLSHVFLTYRQYSITLLSVSFAIRLTVEVVLYMCSLYTNRLHLHVKLPSCENILHFVQIIC